jgi:uncharacterized membrane protein (UPF0182 family)
VPQDKPTVQDAGIQGLISKANDVFIKAKEAQQKGDWAEYGVQLKELEELLKQLDASSKESTVQK